MAFNRTKKGGKPFTVFRLKNYFSQVLSNLSIYSSGNGGEARGFTAIDISLTGLSSAAILFELSAPHRLHLCITAHSPFLRTHTPMGSMIPPQSAERSPGSLSKWTLDKHTGQWFLFCVPAPSVVTLAPHTRQIKGLHLF